MPGVVNKLMLLLVEATSEPSVNLGIVGMPLAVPRPLHLEIERLWQCTQAGGEKDTSAGVTAKACQRDEMVPALRVTLTSAETRNALVGATATCAQTAPTWSCARVACGVLARGRCH